MRFSPDVLRSDLLRTIGQIDEVIMSVRMEADSMKIPAHHLRDNAGNWVLAPLLVAKAQALTGLAMLNQKAVK